MKLPKIDLASLPDLHSIMPSVHSLVGTFGSTRTPTPGFDDSIIVIATIVYESSPPGSGIL